MCQKRYPYTPVEDYLPEGQTENWAVERFDISEREVNFVKARNCVGARRLLYLDAEPGRYTRLRNLNGACCPMMSDTPMEKRTCSDVVRFAHGKVLVAGLGLGMILPPILAKKSVSEVRVIELEPEIIELVAPHVKKVPGGEKLMVIQSDIHDYWTPADDRFNTVWFDIWGDFCIDNLAEMTRLHQRWRHRIDKSDPAAFMASWGKDILLMFRDEYHRSGY